MRSGRAHLEVRKLASEEREAHAALASRLEETPHVRWARFNAPLGRIVVDFEPGALDLDALVDRVEALEDALRIGHRPFAPDVPPHPGDREPSVRAVVEAVADAAGIALGTGRRLAGVRPAAGDIDIAALIAALRGIPSVRGVIDARLGAAKADLALGLADAFANAMIQGTWGPSTDILHRLLRLRELRARREAFEAREEELAGRPELHPPRAPAHGRRPGALPNGPVEDYTDKAVVAALGGFGVGVAATGAMHEASGSIFGGIPKPARIGRDAFAAWLGTRLAAMGMVVMDPAALRRLDRLDVVVLHQDVGDDPVLRALLAPAREAGLELLLAGDAERAEALRIRHRLPPGHGLARGIRELQADGRGVLLIAAGDCPAYGVADVGVGLHREDRGTPWSAHLILNDRFEEVGLVLAAVGAARTASRHSTWMAATEAVAAMLLSFGGLKRRGVRRILLASNLASVVAMGNAVRIARDVGWQAPPIERERTPWHALEVDDVLRHVESRPEGLDDEEAGARRRTPEAEARPGADLLAAVGEELVNPLAPMLAAGSGLSALMGSAVDAAMLAGVMGLNAVIGGVQRFRTEQELAAFDRRERPAVRVRRGGASRVISADELVTGDVVEVRSGDIVPADCRLVEGRALEMDESDLTGESLPVTKDPAPSSAEVVAERRSMLFAGTTVAAGEGVAVVVALGAQTEAGRAAAEAAEASPATGVELRLQELTELTAPLAAISGIGVVLAGLARNRPPEEYVGAAVSLAVAAVPEGLPVLATVAQLSAARRLSERGALARNPKAVEALGRIDVLCADKTGTLTEGKLRLHGASDGDRYQEAAELDDALRGVVQLALRGTPEPEEGEKLPHLTDEALASGAHDIGISSGEEWEPTAELPFEPKRSYHAALGSLDGGWQICVKGAPEVVIERCTHRTRGGRRVRIGGRARRRLQEHAVELAGRGLRVLALACRSAEEGTELTDEAVGELDFAGFVALSDPIRASAREAVERLRRAGVEVMMITGDHPETAAAIGAELDLHGTVLTGRDLEELDEDALVAALRDTRIVARVSPRQKVRIVRALQAAGRVVGMTGDGANDAPAIRLSDAGIALGAHSTQAARHAADLVVTDGRIETIVDAVMEGRALWVSVREAVSVLVGGNLGEIGFTLLGGLLSGRTPLNARQLILVNLFTDALPALAIALMPPEGGQPEALLEEGPDRSLGRALDRDLAWRAVVTGGAASAAWTLARITHPTRATADTVGLLALVGAQLGQTLVIGRRSGLVRAASLGSAAGILVVVETPGLSHFFGCRPLGPIALAQAALVTTAATGASVAGPRVARRLAPRIRGWLSPEDDREWVRALRESRMLERFREAGREDLEDREEEPMAQDEENVPREEELEEV